MNPQLVKRIGTFLLRFALVYAIAIALWSVVGGGYRAYFCGLGNFAFGGGEARAKYDEAPPNPADLDVKIGLTTPSAPGTSMSMYSSSRFVGYLPTVSLVAFILATPISWKRRRKALLWGLLVVHVLVLLRMWFPLVLEFSKDTVLSAQGPVPNPLKVHELGSFSRSVLELAMRALLHAPASWFIGPILIWAAVAFRREDWELVTADPANADETPSSDAP